MAEVHFKSEDVKIISICQRGHETLGLGDDGIVYRYNYWALRGETRWVVAEYE